MNFCLVGKFKVQRCRNFKFSGLEVVHIQKILGIDVGVCIKDMTMLILIYD